MFISFEGIDFSGKSTQIALLKECLESNGNKVLVIREPGGGEIEEKIRDILLDKKNLGLTSEAEILLFSASRAQLVRKTIVPHLQSGYIVISDRFHDSTSAYQGYGRNLPLQVVNVINQFAIDGAVPAITFFIDIPVEKARERKQSQQSRGLDRIEIMDDEFFNRVRDGYLKLSLEDPRIKIMNGCLSKDELHANIKSELNKFGLCNEA